jgi:hypothetical protein
LAMRIDRMGGNMANSVVDMENIGMAADSFTLLKRMSR